MSYQTALALSLFQKKTRKHAEIFLVSWKHSTSLFAFDVNGTPQLRWWRLFFLVVRPSGEHGEEQPLGRYFCLQGFLLDGQR